MSRTLSYRIGTLQKPHLPFSRVADLGIGGIELVWNDQTSAQAVQQAIAPSGLAVTSIHVPCPLEDENLPASMAAWAAQAAQLGTQYFFVSAHAGDHLSKTAAYDRLRRIGDAIAPHNIALALETHPDLCQNAAQMQETMAAVDHPSVGVNYDTGNIYYYNESGDAVEQLKPVTQLLRGVHLKDTMGGFQDFNFPVFGEGIVDFAAVDALIAPSQYTGPYCMELEGGAFDCPDADELAAKVGRCVAHLQQLGLC